jgi:hypothetical protein
VRGKGRLKGSKGNGKNDRVTGMRITFKISYIAVVILHFLIYLSTRRNPSLFEFTSTAPAVLGSSPLAVLRSGPPAVLGSGPPAMQTAVDDFMALLSTTQLGFERTVGVDDTYIPRTVPERLYKRAAKAYESDDASGAFILTLNVFAPTPTEVKAVQAEVDDDALTKAIEAIKSTVRLSSRLRVDTLKVQLNKEFI